MTKIETRVSFADYKLLQEISRDYGFKSVYQLLSAVVGLLLASIKGKRYRHDTEPPNEIVEMFSELEALDNEYRNPRREEL